MLTKGDVSSREYTRRQVHLDRDVDAAAIIGEVEEGPGEITVVRLTRW